MNTVYICIRKLFYCPGQTAPLFIALHVILAPHSYLIIEYGCFQMEVGGSAQQELLLSRDGQLNPSPVQEDLTTVRRGGGRGM